MSFLDFYVGGLRKLSDILDDDERSDALIRVYLDETDAIAKRILGKFLKAMIEAIPMSQQEIARTLAVSPSLVTAWKKNAAISAVNLLQLIRLATITKAEIPSFPNLPTETAEMAPAVMKAMELLAIYARQENTALTEGLYRCIREAAKSKEWWNARKAGDARTINAISSALMDAAGVLDWTADRMQTAVDEWCPFFIVCVDHIKTH